MCIRDRLKAVGSEKKTLIVLPELNEKVIASAANIPGVKTAMVNTLNVYDILNADKFIVVKDAVAQIEEMCIRDSTNPQSGCTHLLKDRKFADYRFL